MDESTWTLKSLYFILLLISFSNLGKCENEKIRDEEAAREFVREFDEIVGDLYNQRALAHWAYETNITQLNKQKTIEAEVEVGGFLYAAIQNASLYDWEYLEDERTKRLFYKIMEIGNAALSKGDLKRLESLLGDMKSIYGSAKVCGKPKEDPDKCYQQELQTLITTSRDWDELTWAWQGWRDVTGKVYKDKYVESVELYNKASQLQAFDSLTEMWQSKYEVDDLNAIVMTLWDQVKPLYQQLHAYTRRKLIMHYGQERFPETGHIPAHILGNMWGQSWSALTDLLLPFPNTTFLDVTTALKEQGYTPLRMFKAAEEFFTSLGLEPLTDAFWEKSMIEKPTDGRQVVCHASAWSFFKDEDFRIKMCTLVNDIDFLTIHHEIGHIQYSMLYDHQPINFQSGANPGFHEAVGDVISLSVMTPEHLHTVGLLPHVIDDEAFDLNFLMRTALDKIAFLPFGLLVDKWRWQVFDGDVTPEEYNRAWWKLRCGMQGVSPPVQRTENDFDAGSKFHVPAAVPYIRYFVSFILQFQFHKSLCEASGHTGPLHRCDIYRSREAGDKLKAMLELGSSRPWPDALEQLTGQRHIDAAPLVEYFQPILDWLRKQNGGYDVTWDDECPTRSVVAGNGVKIGTSYYSILVSIFVIVKYTK